VGTEYWLPSTRTRLSRFTRHPVEPVRRGGRPQRAERLPFRGQELPRDLPMRLRDLAVLLRTPGGALRAEIVVVDEGPPGQEVRLHKLDQVLDGPLLPRGVGIAELGMETEFGGEAGKRRVPPRLPARP